MCYIQIEVMIQKEDLNSKCISFGSYNYQAALINITLNFFGGANYIRISKF